MGTKGGIVNKKYRPKKALAEFMGSDRPITRAEIVSELWAYAHDNNLSTTKKAKTKKGKMRNWAAIKPDATLRPILGNGPKTVGEISKALSKHLQ